MVDVRTQAFGAPIVDPKTGRPTVAFQRYLHDVLQRIGGTGDVTLQAAGDDLTAIEALTGTGPAVRVATNTWTQRDLAVAGGLFIADSDWISGDPTFDAALQVFEVTVGQADVASAASKILLTSATGETWKVLDIWYDGTGTDWSGGGGDRLLDVTDGTSVWTAIPAATLAGVNNNPARWGDADLPNPGTHAHLFAASASGTNIVAKYSGGATDYTAGSLVIRLTAYRTA